MFVVLIDRLRQRVLTTVRILFLVALVAVLTVQLYGLLKTGLALRSGLDEGQSVSGTPDRSFQVPSRSLLDTLTGDLREFYRGR